MAFPTINLAGTEFPTSNLFNYLPKFEEIYYQGNPLEHVQSFKAVREGQVCKLLAVTIIRKDEDFLWDSTKDLLVRAVKDAAAMMRGEEASGDVAWFLAGEKGSAVVLNTVPYEG